MKVETNAFVGSQVSAQSSAAETVVRDRKQAEASSAEPKELQKKVASEELLGKIKELTEDGLYSVRFEKNKEIDSLVVKVVDRDSGEVIRQIPPEELLGLTKRLEDFRGIVVRTEG